MSAERSVERDKVETFDRQTGGLEGLDAGLYIVTAKTGVMSSGLGCQVAKWFPWKDFIQ